jgi:hypothetical protein
MPPLCPSTRARLGQIAVVYHELRLLDQANRLWVAQQRARRIREFNEGLEKIFKAVDVWLEEINAVEDKCEELLDKHLQDPSSVTPEDWTLLAQGASCKINVIYGRAFPRESWPDGIRYLNLIALREHYQQQNRDIEAELEHIREMRHQAAQEEDIWEAMNGLADLNFDADMDIEQFEEE